MTKKQLVKLASLCSGSNVAFLVQFTLMLLLLGANHCTYLFDVEKDDEKQRWLENVVNRSFGSQCIYKEMGEVDGDEAWCTVYKK